MWRVNIHLTLHICCVAVNLEDTHFICLFQTAEAGVYHLYQNFKMCFTQTDSLVSFKFCSLNVNLGSRLLFYDSGEHDDQLTPAWVRSWPGCKLVSGSGDTGTFCKSYRRESKERKHQKQPDNKQNVWLKYHRSTVTN